jgi:hypothetical protein
MDFLNKLFAKLLAALAGTPPALNVGEKVKELYPDALYLKDIFPRSVLNVEFVVLPSVEGGLPADLADVIQKKDGIVTVVFTGETAKQVAAVATDAAGVASVLAEKLLEKTEIDEALKKLMGKITDLYNAIMPGEVIPTGKFTKKVLGMVAAFLRKQEAFKSAKALSQALIEKFVVDGGVRFEIPDVIEGKLASLGLDKLAEKNDTVQVVVKVLEAQVNTVLENALKNLKGDVTVH